MIAMIVLIVLMVVAIAATELIMRCASVQEESVDSPVEIVAD